MPRNKTLKKLKLSRGYIASVSPLVKCLYTFTCLSHLELSYLKLSKLHFMAIDNYMAGNVLLRSLKLIGVRMDVDSFKEISQTIKASTALRTLDISQNKLRNAGCREVASIL